MLQRSGDVDRPEFASMLQTRTLRKWAGQLGKDPIDVEWTHDDFRKARDVAPASQQDLKWPSAAAVEIALKLEKDEAAENLLRQHLVEPLTMIGSWERPYTLDVLKSPGVWRLLCDGWLGKELSTMSPQVVEWVDEVLRYLEERLKNGVKRPFTEKTIEELVYLFNDVCVKNKRLGGKGVGADFSADNEIPELRMPSTFLRSPATEDEIEELEVRAKENGYANGLPKDYKALLRVTNGIYAHDNKDADSNMFEPTGTVSFPEEDCWPVELLPTAALGWAGDGTEIEWPEMEITLDLGRGGHEKNHWLVFPSLLDEAVQAYEQALREADKDDRKRIQRAATDIYGSIEGLSGVNNVVLRMFHKDAVVEPFASFRDLLETSVLEAMRYGKIHGTYSDGDIDSKEIVNSAEEENGSESKAAVLWGPGMFLRANGLAGKGADQDREEGSRDEAEAPLETAKRERSVSQDPVSGSTNVEHDAKRLRISG